MREADASQIVKLYDGNVLIRGPAGTYIDTVENFALDDEEQFPGPLNGALGRTYIPGVKHRLIFGNKQIQESLPWTPGDAILDRLDVLLAAKAVRDATGGPPPDPGLRDKRVAAFEAMLARLAQDPNATQEEKDYQDARGGGGGRER